MCVCVHVYVTSMSILIQTLQVCELFIDVLVNRESIYKLTK